jgi:hypothetical protein
MTKFEEVREWILDNASISEISILWDALKERRDSLASRLKFHYKKGDAVQFTSKKGREIYGTIDKINRSTASITPKGEEFARWRVPFTMLSKTQ